MSNTITIELCQEDRKRLDELIAFAGLIAGEMKSKPQTLEHLVTPGTLPAPAEEPQKEQDAPEEEEAPAPLSQDVIMPQPEPEPAKPAITLDMIRQKVTALLAAGGTKKNAARDIVKTYAPNITGLNNCADKWPEIWEQLTAVEEA